MIDSSSGNRSKARVHSNSPWGTRNDDAPPARRGLQRRPVRRRRHGQRGECRGRRRRGDRGDGTAATGRSAPREVCGRVGNVEQAIGTVGQHDDTESRRLRLIVRSDAVVRDSRRIGQPPDDVARIRPADDEHSTTSPVRMRDDQTCIPRDVGDPLAVRRPGRVADLVRGLDDLRDFPRVGVDDLHPIGIAADEIFRVRDPLRVRRPPAADLHSGSDDRDVGRGARARVDAAEREPAGLTVGDAGEQPATVRRPADDPGDALDHRPCGTTLDIEDDDAAGSGDERELRTDRRPGGEFAGPEATHVAGRGFEQQDRGLGRLEGDPPTVDRPPRLCERAAIAPGDCHGPGAVLSDVEVAVADERDRTRSSREVRWPARWATRRIAGLRASQGLVGALLVRSERVLLVQESHRADRGGTRDRRCEQQRCRDEDRVPPRDRIRIGQGPEHPGERPLPVDVGQRGRDSGRHVERGPDGQVRAESFDKLEIRGTTVVHRSASRARSSEPRAAWSLDFTVPTGIPRVRAISATGRSST